MDEQEAMKWAYGQDVVKVTCVKKGEEDKYVFTVGEYIATPHVFDTQEEAMDFLDEHFKLRNMDLAIIGAMCQRLNDLSKQQLKNETK